MNLITIASFTDSIRANLTKTRLESEGIICFLTDENVVSMLPFYSLAIGNIKLKVPEDQYSKAKSLLKKDIPKFSDHFIIREENKNTDDIKCPNCFSLNIYKEELSKKSVLSFLFLGFPIPIFSKKFHCFDCGFQWKERRKKH